MIRASKGVLDVTAEFGCWMWAEEPEPLIAHLNGRKLMSRADTAELAAAHGLRVAGTSLAADGHAARCRLVASSAAPEEAKGKERNEK